jgi:SHS family sialic acid transporter-like MFS transporter
MSEGKLTRGQWLVLAAAFLGWMFDGVEMGLFPLIARPALQDLMGVTADAQVGQWNGYLVACFMLGAACGGLVFGWLGDKIGRVRSMALSILVYSGFTGLCYFAVQPWHLGALRFLAALGMGGQWALGVALVMECWPERHRPMLAGIIGAAANVGFLLISVVGMFFAVTVETTDTNGNALTSFKYDAANHMSPGTGYVYVYSTLNGNDSGWQNAPYVVTMPTTVNDGSEFFSTKKR